MSTKANWKCHWCLVWNAPKQRHEVTLDNCADFDCLHSACCTATLCWQGVQVVVDAIIADISWQPGINCTMPTNNCRNWEWSINCHTCWMTAFTNSRLEWFTLIQHVAWIHRWLVVSCHNSIVSVNCFVISISDRCLLVVTSKNCCISFCPQLTTSQVIHTSTAIFQTTVFIRIIPLSGGWIEIFPETKSDSSSSTAITWFTMYDLQKQKTLQYLHTDAK